MLLIPGFCEAELHVQMPQHSWQHQTDGNHQEDDCPTWPTNTAHVYNHWKCFNTLHSEPAMKSDMLSDWTQGPPTWRPSICRREFCSCSAFLAVLHTPVHGFEQLLSMRSQNSDPRCAVACTHPTHDLRKRHLLHTVAWHANRTYSHWVLAKLADWFFVTYLTHNPKDHFWELTKSSHTHWRYWMLGALCISRSKEMTGI